MNWPFIFLAMLGGAVTPLQAGLNNRLGRELGSPWFGTWANFIVGALAASTVVLALRIPWPTFAACAGAPWWAWLGGLCGVTLVFSATASIPHLGYAGLILAIVAGQILASLVLDHFGFVGQRVREISPMRLGGVALVLLGMFMVQRS
jgi:transporter family-2 protein